MVGLQRFLKWVKTARVSERAAAASALSRAYLEKDLPFDDRCAAEAALTLLLDDPSAKVRLALSETLSLSPRAPLQVVVALAADQPAVAAPILVRSPVLTDSDLIDLVAAGCAKRQQLIAMRPRVSMALAAALAEVGEAEACLEMLNNSGAEIASVSFRRMVERHADEPVLREALIADRRLPSDCRHTLLMSIGEALRRTPLVVALIGEARAEKLTRDACAKASMTLLDNTEPHEHPALVEHLRMRGELTTGLVMRAVAHGKIDFFGAALVALGGQDERKVHALLAGGRDAAVAVLIRKAGLPEPTHPPVLRALKLWREVANGKRIAGPQEVSWLMLKELEGRPEADDFARLLRSIHLEVLRDNARREALAIAAA